MKLSVEEFTRDVVSCGLLTPADIEPLVRTLASDKTDAEPTKLAKKLVSAGKLTKYQAANALQGKAKNLVFGDYVVLDAIGAGGMGQVFKAEHRRMQRVVALKILPPAAVKSPAAVERFEREVRVAARLEHPNVVTAHDAGEANGVHFLVMQYVDGQDLASLVAERGPLPPSKAVNYVLQAARGLTYAHGKGVIHRDVKPANLLLNQEGMVKILDLGLARLASSLAPEPAHNPTMTACGDVMGTADYMSPEQAEDAHQADARADVYSLGCTLYFLLTGEGPYRGATLVQKMLAHRQQPVPSLSHKSPGVPQALERVFARMVAKRPADRFQTMREVIAALEPLESTAVNPAATVTVNPLVGATTGAETTPGGAAAPARRTALLNHQAVRKTWLTTAKFIGPLFATIIAPILVGLILNRMGSDPPPGGQPAASQPPEDKPPAEAEKTPKVPKPDEFAPLFNGRDLTGWGALSQQKNWRVKDGVLIGSGKGPAYLYSERSNFTNFRLRLRARINDRSNAGVYVRSTSGPVLPANAPRLPGGYEAQIFCGQGKESNKTGSIYMGHTVVAGVAKSPVLPNQWFILEVTANDSVIEVKVNGETTARYRDPKRTYQIGHIALQQYGDETVVEFSEIEVQELTSNER